MDELIPVEGCGSDKIIGHWNMTKNKFEPSNDSVIDDLINEHKNIFRSEPMVIRVSKSHSREGNFITYSSFDDYDKERIIANVEANPYEKEKWWI